MTKTETTNAWGALKFIHYYFYFCQVIHFTEDIKLSRLKKKDFEKLTEENKMLNERNTGYKILFFCKNKRLKLLENFVNLEENWFGAILSTIFTPTQSMYYCIFA